MDIAQPRESLELLKVTFVCGASVNKVPIKKGKQHGLDLYNI